MEKQISFIKYIRGNELVDDPENAEFRVIFNKTIDRRRIYLKIKDKINGIKVELHSNCHQGTYVKFEHNDKTEYHNIDCELIHKLYIIMNNFTDEIYDQQTIESIKSIMASTLQLNVVHDQYVNMFDSPLVNKMKRIDFFNLN